MVTVDDNKGNFYPSNGVISQKFLLLLSPGYQGLSKNLLDNIIEDKNVKDVFLLYLLVNRIKTFSSLHLKRLMLNFYFIELLFYLRMHIICYCDTCLLGK